MTFLFPLNGVGSVWRPWHLTGRLSPSLSLVAEKAADISSSSESAASEAWNNPFLRANRFLCGTAFFLTLQSSFPVVRFESEKESDNKRCQRRKHRKRRHLEGEREFSDKSTRGLYELSRRRTRSRRCSMDTQTDVREERERERLWRFRGWSAEDVQRRRRFRRLRRWQRRSWSKGLSPSLERSLFTRWATYSFFSDSPLERHNILALSLNRSPVASRSSRDQRRSERATSAKKSAAFDDLTPRIKFALLVCILRKQPASLPNFECW